MNIGDPPGQLAQARGAHAVATSSTGAIYVAGGRLGGNALSIASVEVLNDSHTVSQPAHRPRESLPEPGFKAVATHFFYPLAGSIAQITELPNCDASAIARIRFCSSSARRAPRLGSEAGELSDARIGGTSGR